MHEYCCAITVDNSTKINVTKRNKLFFCPRIPKNTITIKKEDKLYARTRTYFVFDAANSIASDLIPAQKIIYA